MEWDLYNEYLFKSSDLPWLWLISIGFMLVISIRVLKISKTNEILDTTKAYIRANVLFLVFYTGARCCFLFSNFYYEIYPLEYESYSEFQLLIRTAYSLGLVGLTLLIYGIEKNFLSTKGLLSVLPVIALAIALFLPYDTFRIITYIVQFIVIAVIFALYLYVLMKSTGEVRSDALFNLIGLILLMVAVMFDSITGKEIMTENGVRWLAYKLSPIIFIIGICVLSNGWVKRV